MATYVIGGVELRETAWWEAYSEKTRVLVQKHSGKVLTGARQSLGPRSRVCVTDHVALVWGRHGHYLG
jgi:uncharacterized protein (DUF1330 family)